MVPCLLLPEKEAKDANQRWGDAEYNTAVTKDGQGIYLSLSIRVERHADPL